MDDRSNAAFSAALLGFVAEASEYCNGISDRTAQEYAIEYSRMLQDRSRGGDPQLPRLRTGLFEPNRNLIRSTLERMWTKHFPSK